jgi:acyl dehydratase
LIIWKYIAKFLGQGPRLQPASNGADFALPLLSLEAPLEISVTDIKQFDAAVGNDKHCCNNSSPLLVAAITTPMMLILLSNSACPVLPFGAVNTKNRFDFLNPGVCRRPISLEGAVVRAQVGGAERAGRRVKRGMEFDVVVEVNAKSKGTTERTIIFRQIISILVFLPKKIKSAWAGEEKETTEAPKKTLNQPEQLINLTSDAPKKWAAICNDINPIHMSSVAARLFGFPGKIAHGNHVVARVVEQQRSAELRHEMGKLIWESEKPSFIEVAFKRPMVLPISLSTRFEVPKTGPRQNSRCFEVVKDDKTYIEGSLGVL